MNQNARKTHCIRGHLLDEANVRVHDGRRHCRPCQRERGRAYRTAAVKHLTSPRETFRFLATRDSHTDTSAVTGCWTWAGSLDTSGYGRAFAATGAHRMAYIAEYGAIPAGLEIDHLCRNRACVNPRHLEAVPHHVNTMRGDTIASRNRAKTHCVQGHPFTPDNTHTNRRGHRKCRACWRDQQRRYRQRKAQS